MLRLPPMRISHIAVAAALVTIFSIALKPVTDPDFWWHLATGTYIVTHHMIPTHDVFSLTAQSHRWITHEWLTEILFYAGWTFGGYRLLMLATALVISAAFAIGYRTARIAGAPALVSAPLVLLAALASAHTWGTRPQMLSVLFMAIFTLALTRMIVERRPAPPAWLPLLMVLWVNLHGGFIFGIALMALATGGYVLQELWSAAEAARQQRLAAEREALAYPELPWSAAAALSEANPIPAANVLRCLGLTALTALAALLNPNGLAGALYPLSYLGNNASTRYIAEWVSPDFHKVQYLLFEGMVLLILVAAMAGRRRARLPEILVLIPFTYLAFESVRNINLFAVIATPIAASLIAGVLPHALPRPQRNIAVSKQLFNLLAATVVVLAVAIPSFAKLSQGAQDKAVAAAFPVRALRYIKSQGLPLRGFDSYNWGGFLIWSLYPGRLIYVDGRPDMYGDHFMDQYIHAYEGDPSWKRLFAQNALCYALVEPSSGIARALRRDRHWLLRYHDSQAVLYVADHTQQGCK